MLAIPADYLIVGAGRQRAVLGQLASSLAERLDEIMEGLERDGWIEVRGADEDLGALGLLHKLAKKQRARWPEFATIDAPRLVGA